MDNAKIHHSEIVHSFIKDRKFNVLYTAPYCPELNFVEYMFKKIKYKVKKETIKYTNQ